MKEYLVPQPQQLRRVMLLKLKIALIVLAVFAVSTPAIVTASETLARVKEVVLKDSEVAPETIQVVSFRQALSSEEVQRYRQAFESLAMAINPKFRVYAEARKDGGVNFVFSSL